MMSATLYEKRILRLLEIYDEKYMSIDVCPRINRANEIIHGLGYEDETLSFGVWKR